MYNEGKIPYMASAEVKIHNANAQGPISEIADNSLKTN